MDSEAIEDLFSGLGPVTIKRMFGGKGVYRNGLIVAIDLNSELMLKADRESAPLFAAAGARPVELFGKGGQEAGLHALLVDSRRSAR